jgi:hypothetical protein
MDAVLRESRESHELGLQRETELDPPGPDT